MLPTMLDTDILSELMRGHHRIKNWKEPP